jgi:hypothetical protein
MIIRRLLFALSLAGALAGQTFVQMSDPQFGMFTKNASFEHETVTLEFAIANANRLKPAFVIVTGDLIKLTAAAVFAKFGASCAAECTTQRGNSLRENGTIVAQVSSVSRGTPKARFP